MTTFVEGHFRIMTTSAASSWEAEIDAWTTKLRAGGRRPQTIALRRGHIRRLGVWAAPRGPWELSTDDLLAWTGSKDWKPTTRRSVRSSLRGFYTWGLTSRRISENPSTELPAIRAPRPRPRPCDMKMFKAAIKAAPARDVWMLRLAAECGMRRGEVAQVHPRRDVIVDLLNYSLIVHGKGGKTRVIALTEHLGAALATEARKNDGYLFPGRIDGHLSASWVGRVVSSWLDDGWTMHTLRHMFATSVYRKTRDLLAVQAHLGHESPATTQIYVEVERSAQQQLVDSMAELLGIIPGPETDHPDAA